MISFATSDSTIWYRDQFIINVVAEMIRGSPTISLSTRGEGPCAESLGLYKLLDQLCLKFGYDKQCITLHTCNLAERHSQYNIKIVSQVMYLNSARGYAIPDAKKNWDNIKHFGHFIGHGNQYRLATASVLHTEHADKTLQTYHCNPTNPYHRCFIGLEDMMFNGATHSEITAAVELIKQAPIVQDDINQYPILNPVTLNITRMYPTFFVEIVNFSYWSGNTFYLDEKIWRPILMRTPFIVQGPQNFILRLRELGFRTFHDYWDEGYSEDPAPCHTPAIHTVLRGLATKPISELQNMYNEMTDTLEHNYHLFKTITPAQMASVCQK
jgi:hypothetical protein